MLYRDCIEKLLQLKDVIVTNIECQGREMHIWLRMEQRMHFCPCCGTITGKVHDYRTQLVKDISISGYDTILHLRKRRHVCPECGKRFDERIDFLPRYRQFTNRVSMQIFEQLKECRSIKSIAVQNNMSPPTAAKRLSRWIMDAQKNGLMEFIKVSFTYQNWSKEILNSFEYPYTNGYIEGCNNRIKVLKRISFGMPRFVRFRRRIMHIMLD